MNSPVILITGAGKGIGKAVVELIIAKAQTLSSPKLLITSRTLSDLEPIQLEAKKAGVDCATLALDLASDPTLPVKQIVQKYGRLDQVVHCAGVGRFKDFLDLTRDDLEFTMKTNVEASFLFMQAAYAQMKTQKKIDPTHRGDLLWITSVAAEQPFEQSAAYCMSKYAQKGLIDVMRLYGHKDGIRIIEVKPGAVITPMWGEVSNEMIAKMMQPADIADAIFSALIMPTRTSVEEIILRPLQGDL